MSQLDIGGFSVADSNEGKASLPKAIVGAIGGALVMGIVYGVVGKFVAEFQYLAVAVGAVSGLAAMKLGGGRSIIAGGVAAVASLGFMLVAKLIVGVPDGVDMTFMQYHMTPFDILFCYVANPAAAFFVAGTDQARHILNKLPF